LLYRKTSQAVLNELLTFLRIQQKALTDIDIYKDVVPEQAAAFLFVTVIGFIAA